MKRRGIRPGVTTAEYAGQLQRVLAHLLADLIIGAALAAAMLHEDEVLTLAVVVVFLLWLPLAVWDIWTFQRMTVPVPDDAERERP